MIVDEVNLVVAPEDEVCLVLRSVGEVNLVVAAVDKVDLVLGSADEVNLILLIVTRLPSLSQLWTKSRLRQVERERSRLSPASRAETLSRNCSYSARIAEERSRSSPTRRAAMLSLVSGV